ncbi:uncharacterized protein [Dysidea avara]|uniref:uncharacterized protein isoform X2 n=1 Tax=Dysidea avara TaxID=196820 RepID=UPI003327DE54
MLRDDESFHEDYISSILQLVWRNCYLTSGIPVWTVNGALYSLNDLFNGLLPGHNISGTNILVTSIVLGDNRNGSMYQCLIPQTPPLPDILSDPAFLYVAGVPDMVPGFGLFSNMIVVDMTKRVRNFTLSWDKPFDNFDPILNYTIITSCSDNTVCPVTHVTGSDVTTLDISYTLPIITVNYTISISANNTFGASDPVMRVLAAPNIARNVAVMCAPLDLLNRCTVTWNPLSYGNNAIPLPITYTVRYSGVNVTTGIQSDDGVTALVFLQPAVDGRIFATVEAENAFGSAGVSSSAEDDITASSVQGTRSSLLNAAQFYNLEVVCDISPSSTADYCEVFAHGPNSITASATIVDDMATVTISSLQCEGTYSITAGGIVDQTLDGPRFHIETITAAECVMIPTATSSLMIATPTSTVSSGSSGGSSDSDDSTGAIIGIVVGGICGAIVVVVVIIIVIYCCCYREDKESSDVIAMSNIPPTVQLPLSDNVQMNTNPAYAVSTAGTVKMEDNPAYQTMTTNPGGGGGGAGIGGSYYEDIIDDRNVKMTQNPAYTVP